jgi:hypothetical protein
MKGDASTGKPADSNRRHEMDSVSFRPGADVASAVKMSSSSRSPSNRLKFEVRHLLQQTSALREENTKNDRTAVTRPDEAGLP